MSENGNNRDISFLLKRICDSFERISNQAFERLDLTLSQARVLHFLVSRGGCAAQKDIEAHLGVSHPTVVGIVQRLEAKGFVETHQEARQHNAKMVSLHKPTPPSISEEMRRFPAELESRLTKGMSEAEQEQLAVLLQRVFFNLEDA